MLLAGIIRKLIIYFIRLSPREIILPFFFVKAMATTWSTLSQGTKLVHTRACVCDRITRRRWWNSHYITLNHKRIFRCRVRSCVGSNSINRTSSIVYIKAVHRLNFRSLTERNKDLNEHIFNGNLKSRKEKHCKRTSSGQAFCCCTLVQFTTCKGSLIVEHTCVIR